MPIMSNDFTDIEIKKSLFNNFTPLLCKIKKNALLKWTIFITIIEICSLSVSQQLQKLFLKLSEIESFLG